MGHRTDLMVRALEGSTITDRGEYIVVRTPANPAFWWGNYLLVPPVPGDARRWLSAFAAELPAAAHVALGIDIADDAGADLTGFTGSGLTVLRETVLTAAVPREPRYHNRAAQVRPLADDSDWQQSASLRAPVVTC